MEEGNLEMNARIAQQQAMIEQQRQDELLRLQHSAIQEIAKDSMSEHEMEMQRQMMSVLPPGTTHLPPPGTNVLPPPPPPQISQSAPSLTSHALPNLTSHPPPPPNLTLHAPPPPNIISHAPPSITSLAPPNLTSHVPPPPNLMSHAPPPPNLTSHAPPNIPHNTSIPSLMSTPLQRPLMPPPGPPPQLINQWSSNEGPKDLQPPGVEVKELPSLLSLHVEKPEELRNKSSEVVLPKALEQVLALKDRRARELGVEDENATNNDNEVLEAPPPPKVISSEYTDDADVDSDEEMESTPLAPPPPMITARAETRQNKNKKKKEKKKRARMNKDEARRKAEEMKKANDNVAKTNKETGENDVEVEYIQEALALTELAPMHRQFYKIFEAFKIAEQPAEKVESVLDKTKDAKKDDTQKDQFGPEDEDMDEKPVEDKEKLSKRKLKKLTRLSVAELKQLVSRPDVVEMHDVTARDPRLLVQLKAHRNTVQVPRHWCFKRKYLQGKRGIEKPAFDLPAFIKKTGIMEMRASLQDKDETKTLKAKMRERARPKLGKIDIDYQKLHDAFFKWQTKPRMTIHGDLYYEGKEFETRLKEKKPGDLSEELRTALGMPIGSGASKVPPPWLIAQQRYGPPPSYPNLKIPGLNAPIPESCSFGYHAGGWGKPPVDERGRPLYGDVFGLHSGVDENGIDESEIDRTIWGEMESESEESSSEEEEEEETPGEAAGEDASGLVTPAEGLATPSGFSSVGGGMETPDTIELRKKKIESDMEGGETPVLYQVLPERRTERIGGAMMASTHVYDMTGAGGAQPPSVLAAKRGLQHNVAEKEGAIELALDPSELDMDNEAMAMRYEQQIKEQQSHLQKEDLSDMLAEHVARQKSKRKRQQNQESKQAKKYKEFKF